MAITVDHVKYQIWQQEGHRAWMQKLIFEEERALENGRKLAYYNIQNECTLQLVLEPLQKTDCFYGQADTIAVE